MKKIGILTVLGLGLLPAIAFAGQTYPNASSDVEADTTARWAEGTLSAAHNSPDNVQYIGCWVRSTSAADSASCYARTAAGTYVSCSTTSSRLISAIRALHSEARLRFYWDTSFRCTEIEVRTASTEEPLQP